MMSKWAKRLKATKTENSEQCLDLALTKADKTPKKVVSSVIVSSQFRDCLKNNAFETEKNRFRKIEQSLKQELTKADETKNEPTLTDKLNRLIAEGVKFEISADAFQAFGLSERERQTLGATKNETLCTLQQMFLQTHLFNHSPELLESFRMQVLERSAAVSDGANEIVFESVCEVAAEWTADAIEKLNSGCEI